MGCLPVDTEIKNPAGCYLKKWWRSVLCSGAKLAVTHLMLVFQRKIISDLKFFSKTLIREGGKDAACDVSGTVDTSTA